MTAAAPRWRTEMDDSELVRVHLSNGHMVSGDQQGPGVVIIPLGEARALVQRRYARILGPAGQDGDPAAARTGRGVSN